MFARCVYSDTAHFTVGELYSVDLLNGSNWRRAGGIHYAKDNDGDAWQFYGDHAKGVVKGSFDNRVMARFVKW